MGDYKYRVTGPRGGKYLTSTRREAEKLTRNGGKFIALGQRKASKWKNPSLGGAGAWDDFTDDATYAVYRIWEERGGQPPSPEAAEKLNDMLSDIFWDGWHVDGGRT